MVSGCDAHGRGSQAGPALHGSIDRPATSATDLRASAAPSAVPAGSLCDRCGTPTAVAKIASDEIQELSGIAASRVHHGVFYVDNDSGDSARIFAVDEHGRLLSTIKLASAVAVDWEDIAVGPCDGGSCVLVGDIGDNGASRTAYALYRVREPAKLAADATLAADTFPFVYPDGSHDAESLLVHPTTGVVTIVTKVKRGPSGIYELVLGEPGQKLVAKKVGEVTPPSGINLFTAGDVRPDARGVLLRTYTNVFFYPMGAGQSAADALAGAPCEVPAPIEPQGEAIAWLVTGDGYVTSTEGAHPDLSVVTCGGTP